MSSENAYVAVPMNGESDLIPSDRNRSRKVPSENRSEACAVAGITLGFGVCFGVLALVFVSCGFTVANQYSSSSSNDAVPVMHQGPCHKADQSYLRGRPLNVGPPVKQEHGMMKPPLPEGELTIAEHSINDPDTQDEDDTWMVVEGEDFTKGDLVEVVYEDWFAEPEAEWVDNVEVESYEGEVGEGEKVMEYPDYQIEVDPYEGWVGNKKGEEETFDGKDAIDTMQLIQFSESEDENALSSESEDEQLSSDSEDKQSSSSDSEDENSSSSDSADSNLKQDSSSDSTDEQEELDTLLIAEELDEMPVEVERIDEGGN